MRTPAADTRGHVRPDASRATTRTRTYWMRRPAAADVEHGPHAHAEHAEGVEHGPHAHAEHAEGVELGPHAHAEHAEGVELGPHAHAAAPDTPATTPSDPGDGPAEEPPVREHWKRRPAAPTLPYGPAPDYQPGEVPVRDKWKRRRVDEVRDAMRRWPGSR